MLEEAPYLSYYDSDDQSKQKPFLGTGYYFWDYNMPQAMSWGRTHCRGNFVVIESEIEVPDEVYLDLAGSRQDMEYFLNLIERHQKKGIDPQDWELGEFIEFIREENRRKRGIFEFQVIRAEDYLPPAGQFKYLFNYLKNYTNLNPRFIICFLVLQEVFLRTKRIAYES